MPPPDSSAIDAALVLALQSDPELASLMPDGVYMDIAPPGLERFVIVSLIIAEDLATFDGRAIENCLYLVKAVQMTASGADVKAAAARIDAVLEDQPLAAAGYEWSTTHRDERVRYIEVDQMDSTIRWHHRGGRYRVQMACALSSV